MCFNPKGNRILTASSDKTARLWDAATGHCLQVLEGHTDEIFSCAFNYKGDIIITGNKHIERHSKSCYGKKKKELENFLGADSSSHLKYSPEKLAARF